MLEFMGITLAAMVALGAAGVGVGWLVARHRERAFLKAVRDDATRP